MDLSSSFYQTAKEDLEVAILLYREKKYSHAVFNLQQGVEKLSKAFGLKIEVIEPKEKSIKKISHESKRIFNKMVVAQEEQHKRLIEVNNVLPNFTSFNIDGKTIDILEYHNQGKKDRQAFLNLHSKNFKWISESDIDEIINKINSINPDIEPDFKTDDFFNKFDKYIDDVINQLEIKLGIDLSEERTMMKSEEIKELLPSIFSSFVPQISKIGFINIALLFLSLITSSHNQSSRYPCICCGDTPNDNYNGETPIIIKFIELHNVLSQAIKYYEEVFVDEITINE